MKDERRIGIAFCCTLFYVSHDKPERIGGLEYVSMADGRFSKQGDLCYYTIFPLPKC
jgi:hypothetical protein